MLSTRKVLQKKGFHHSLTTGTTVNKLKQALIFLRRKSSPSLKTNDKFNIQLV